MGGLPAGAELVAGAFVLCERLPRAPYGVCVPSGVRPPASKSCIALMRAAPAFHTIWTGSAKVVHT